MNLNKKILYFQEKQKSLKQRLVSEGLTKKERSLLNEINSFLSEAPMQFDPSLGSARPSRTLQSKIETGQTPLSKMGLTQAQVDFFTSNAFKSSLEKLEELLGRESSIHPSLTTANQNLRRDAMTAFRVLMSTVGQLMQELVSLQYDNKEELERIAEKAVKIKMGINKSFYDKMIKLDGELTYGFLTKLSSMSAKVKNVSDKEIEEVFANIDAEKLQKLEDLKQDFDSMGVEFDEEKAKAAIESTFEISPETKAKAKKQFNKAVINQMITNLFRRGMSLVFSDAYKLCEKEIKELPDGERILELSNVIQPIMLHMYWLFDDIGSMGSSGGGQVGQVQVLSPDEAKEEGYDYSEDISFDDEDEEEIGYDTPFVIKARASTFPLLVHELIKGVGMFFTSAIGSEKESKLVSAAATSLETEAYDLVWSSVFFDRFYKIALELISDEKEFMELTPFILKYLAEADEDMPDDSETPAYNLSKDEKTNLQKLLDSLSSDELINADSARKLIENIIERSQKMYDNLKRDYPSFKEKEEKKSEDEDDDYSWY